MKQGHMDCMTYLYFNNIYCWKIIHSLAFPSAAELRFLTLSSKFEFPFPSRPTSAFLVNRNNFNMK